jgi:hypothetical protein
MVIIDEHDLGKTRSQILLDLLYEALGVRLEETWYTKGIPKALDSTPTNPWDANTYMDIQYAPYYKEVKSQQAVMYRRRDIGEHLAQYAFHLTYTRFPTTTSQIVEDLINPHLNFTLLDEDLTIETIDDPTSQQIVIKANPESLIWCGQAKIDIDVPGDEFFVLAQVTVLGGFQPYVDTSSGT